jgi:hypothetical protein
VPHFRFAAAADTRLAAYEALIAPIRPPLMAQPGIPSFAARVDLVTSALLRRLFVDPPPPPPPGVTTTPPPAALRSPVLAPAVAALAGILVNLDGLRSFATRRLAADILKKSQTGPAYVALEQARPLVADQASTSNAPLELRDLLGRIDRYLAAYFD